ncbi:hypothetical protein MTO96_034793 [Rhipicephalus appendiculatus]
MPKGCCVPGCPSTERSCGNAVSFHEVPSDNRCRDAWLEAIAGDDLEERARLLSNARSVVCSLHFKPTDFKVGMKRRVLVTAAVPSIFPSKNATLDPEPPVRKRRRRRTAEPYYYYNVHSVTGVEDVEEEAATAGATAAVDARAASRVAAVPETTTIMILPGMVIRHER